MRYSRPAVLALALTACALGAMLNCHQEPARTPFGAPAPGITTDPRSTTYTNTGVMTAPTNGSWSTATWYQSYAVGADNFDCQSATVNGNGSGPCATVAEIMRRWGGIPVLGQATTINTLATPSTAQALADPWNIRALVTKGGSLTITGPLGTAQTVCTGTLNTVTAKARQSNQNLQSTFTATTTVDGGTCLPVAGQLVVNTSTPDGGPTHNGRAYVHHLVSGSTLALSQPMGAVSNPFQGVLPTEVDTWATTDPVTIYQPVSVNLVAFDVRPTDPSVNGLGLSNVLAYGQILDVNILDPQTTDAGYQVDPVFIGPFVHILESWSQRPVVELQNPGSGMQGVVNSVLAGGGSFSSDHTNLTGPVSTFFPATVVWGGAIGATTATLNEYAGLVMDGDVTISGTVNTTNPSMGWVYIDTSSKLNVTGSADLQNHAVNPVNDGGAGAAPYNVYGPGTLNGAGTGKLVYTVGAAMAANSMGDGGLNITANSSNIVTRQKLDGGVAYNLTLSPAGLDTNLGTQLGCETASGGFSFCNTSP